MRLQLHGKTTTWNDEKGFGFITPTSGNDHVFIHIKSIKKRHPRPQINQQVSYSLSKDKRGRTCAAEVTYTGKPPASPQRRTSQAVAILFVALFFTTLSVLTFSVQIIPLFIIALYTVASTITFFTYAIDKSAAQKGSWRISEATLHSMSLFGGWPGALIAQQTLRHKSSKTEFKAVYKVTAVLNTVVTIWLLTPHGPELTMEFFEKVLDK